MLPHVEAVRAKLGTLSLEAQSKLEQDTAKKEAKAEAKADAALKKKMVCCSPAEAMNMLSICHLVLGVTGS